MVTSLDALNRFPNSNDAEQTVHVMKYIFPRQFGLHNVFTSAVDTRETVQPFKDYTLREEEIARLQKPGGRRPIQLKSKLPKRLRGSLLQLVRKLQKRNQTCSYTELLRHYCPISVSSGLYVLVSLCLYVWRWLIIVGNRSFQTCSVATLRRQMLPATYHPDFSTESVKSR
jgi:hypothetical protein